MSDRDLEDDTEAQKHREHEIRDMVRKQIVYAIDEQLEGGESLLKEVFERMETDYETEIALDELRAIKFRVVPK